MKCPMTGFDCVTCDNECALMRDKGRGAPVADGGPAFPASMLVEGMVAYQAGMSLRDWFAGQAPEPPLWFEPDAKFSSFASEHFDREVRWRWAYADAMLKARQS